MELATIAAFTETGFSDPVFNDSLPTSLAEAGMTEEQWTTFLKSANNSVKFQWGIDTICLFLCNRHNKKVAMNMQNFVQDCDDLLPAGVQILYEMKTLDQVVVHADASTGSTMQTYHKLMFSKLLGHGN
jgi:hypothetical protein